MIQALPYIQVILGVLLIGGILLQRSEASLGASFGADSASGSRFMRRGFEKLLFNATILVAVLFAISTALPLFVSR